MQLVFRKLEFREMQRPKVEIYKAFLFEFPVINDEISNASWTTIDSTIKNSQQRKLSLEFPPTKLPLKISESHYNRSIWNSWIMEKFKRPKRHFFFLKDGKWQCTSNKFLPPYKKIKQVILLTKGIQISQQNNSHEKVLQPKPIKHWP